MEARGQAAFTRYVYLLEGIDCPDGTYVGPDKIIRQRQHLERNRNSI